MIAILTGIVLLAADLLTKHRISSSFEPGQSIPVMENVFHITYARNTGAAFSILENRLGFLIGFTLLACIFLVGLAWWIRRDRAGFLGTVLAVSGALGNLHDRIRFGYVRDFLDFRVFPIFNVADICVVTGMLLVALRIVMLDRAEGKKSEQS